MTASWNRAAFAGFLVATAIASLLAFSAGTVRVLPWILDPSVTWRVAVPFARSLAVVAGEAAMAFGWPLGWAFAAKAIVERGEARVLRLLGEPPLRTVTRLTGQGVFLTLLLGLISAGAAQQSTEPGRVVNELLAEGQRACEQAKAPRAYTVPFFGANWLCRPGLAPRLVGSAPGALADLVFSASRAEVSGDLSALELTDVHVALPHLSLSVDTLKLRGAPSWGPGSVVGPIARAAVVAPAVLLSSVVVVLLVLTGRAPGRVSVLAISAVGPLAVLGLLRLLERTVASRSFLLAVIPLAALLTPAVTAWVAGRLPRSGQAAST